MIEVIQQTKIITATTHKKRNKATQNNEDGYG